jgi:hypothetical protein
MSSTEQMDDVCASCGITQGNGTKLKICTACKLMKYCSVECQKNHWKHHKKACKKREAEMIRWQVNGEQPSKALMLHQRLPLLMRVKGSLDMVDNNGITNHVDGESF